MILHVGYRSFSGYFLDDKRYHSRANQLALQSDDRLNHLLSSENSTHAQYNCDAHDTIANGQWCCLVNGTHTAAGGFEYPYEDSPKWLGKLNFTENVLKYRDDRLALIVDGKENKYKTGVFINIKQEQNWFKPIQMGKKCDMFYACKGRSFLEFSHRACHNQNDP
ncbi:hypothetical protein TNCV_3898211 [Trichonephila clavipes]|nr:hypothetical protein TNCV_3898211 [Trichonephila clavipes]